MPVPPGSARERRRHPRVTPQNIRVWCVSGEFEELYTTVNFSKRLINLSPDGICIETTGRLRPDVKMSIEVRFDEISGSLRSPARIIWVNTEKQGAAEIHKAGLKFVGQVDITKPVRELLSGGRVSMIRDRRTAEYEELKKNSEARKESLVPKKASLLKKLSVTFVALLLLYVGSYWGLVLVRRADPSKPGIRYRYASPDSKELEETMSKVYDPLYQLFRKAGIDLSYQP